ncbi:MAG: pyruvate/oxaloacetate carboxyltransferase [Anaerolineae bacterium]|nr:pyruvate/oxaloacetate carboxyltransferase [Anaerolineae bacterium]MDW8102768.1 pyruvate/oxaloacetate carboxyltransferase [Anaerolineae bacterium]
MKPVRITDTTFRDAHQSLLATRLRTEDMLRIAPLMDKVGFHSMEVWGGATFDAAMRFLNEDPWERLRLLREKLPNTKLQMLLRGQNVVGYRHYPDDVVEKFIVLAKANGIDIFRIFDALNDTRNMAWAMKVAKRVGAHVQPAISYTISPVHTIEKYVEMAKELVDLGADSICIKDMAGLLSPYVAYELVSRLKREVPVPIQVHTHYTSGMGTATLLKAIEAGADVVDTAISTMALGSSQPPTETLVAILRGTPWDPGLDLELLSEIAKYFGEIRAKYKAYEVPITVDVNVLTYQIPGGMLSNLIAQLKEQKALHLLPKVLEEVPRVREELGYPPLVTPTSQIVGTQAVLNVLMGERYKVIPREVKDYIRGLYGRPPGPIDPKVKQLAIGDEEPIDCRPADLLLPALEKAREEIGDLARSEEDVVSYALFPQVARPFLERRAKGVSFKEEIAAAVAASIAANRKPKAPSVPAPEAPAPQVSFSPWKLAARPVGGWVRW